MKKILFYAAVAAFAGLSFSSCAPADKEFNKDFLFSGSGAWGYTDDVGDGPEHLRDTFKSDGTGTTEFITNGAPSQSFTWELRGDELTFYRETTSNTRATVPWRYTVESLTETKMVLIKGSGGKLTYNKE